MTVDTSLLLAFLTWPACLTIGLISICRLNAMQKGVLWRVGAEYALWLAVAVGVPLAPLIDEWPGMVTVGVCYALVLILVCSARVWKGDIAPENARLQHGVTALRVQAQMLGMLLWSKAKGLAESVRARIKTKRG